MDELQELKESFFKSPKVGNNHSELYVDGFNYLPMLLREIRKAKHFIHVQVMLFYSDESGFEVARALAEKAREGVEVRVMSDSGMSNIVRGIEKFRSSGTSSFDDLKELFTKSGVKFISSNRESYWLINWKEKREELEEKGVPEEFLDMQDVIQNGTGPSINVFDHRKTIIFDGETAIITGANIGDKYLYKSQPTPEENEKDPKWHDGAVLIKGPCATILNRHFGSKWMVRGGDVFDCHKHFRKKESYGKDVCTVYSCFPGLDGNPIRDLYVEKMKSTNGPLFIQNPYINDEVFWEQLSNLEEEQARKIVLINPYGAKGNDYPQNMSAIKCNMREPFKKGISFYAYQYRMSHWKLLYDEAASEVFIGSFNLNNRSARHDFEMNVLIESEQLSTQVKKMLEHDMEESRKIEDIEEFYATPNIHPSCLLLKATEYFE